MKMLSIIAAATLSGCVGCLNNNPPTDPQSDPEPEVVAEEVKTGGPARYLCVGMEVSKRFGSCSGCAIDARQINTLLSKVFGYPGDMLISEQATKAAVVTKLREGIEATPEDGLFLFCYSGHGGQEYLGGQEPSGAERKDEYLCLYDTYMQDDEIWDIVSKCKGRVFMYFDACHSATMYRSVASDALVVFQGEARALEAGGLVWSSGFTFRPEDFVSAEAMSADGGRRNPVRMLCWSGCQELEYSYGGPTGGVMTRALVRNWRRGMTYKDLWPRIVRSVQIEQPTQNPQETVIGAGFGDSMEAFK